MLHCLVGNGAIGLSISLLTSRSAVQSMQRHDIREHGGYVLELAGQEHSHSEGHAAWLCTACFQCNVRSDPMALKAEHHDVVHERLKLSDLSNHSG